MTKEEIFISVDIESSGPIPGEYSMLSLGACVVGETEKGFYIELKPLNDNYIQGAIDACHLNMETLKTKGAEPNKAMKDFEQWIQRVSQEKRPVFVAFNATFDWMFVCYYFHRFLGHNPFGISGLDLKAYYMGMTHCSWSETTKRRIDKRFLSPSKHTHNALDDAIEQANIFEKFLNYKNQKNNLCLSKPQTSPGQ
ncbi:MAG: 3'-5' exonuclease [bacterium]